MTGPLPLERARRAARRIVNPLRDEFAMSWPVALLVAGIAAVALAATVPVLSLRSAAAANGTALGLDPIPAIGPVIGWTADVAGPTVTRAAALGQLFEVLTAVAWAVLAVAVVAMFGRLVAQSYERGPEIGIRRAVGASRGHVLGAQLAEAGLVLLIILLIALPAAYVALARSAAGWPGPVAGARYAPLGPVAIVAGALAIGALLPLAHRSARRLVGGDPMPVTLGVPAAQMAASLALLIAGAAMLRHAGGITADGGPTAEHGFVWEAESTDADAAARADAYHSLLTRLAADSRYEVASLTSRGAHTGLGTVDFDVTDCGNCVRGMIVMRWLTLYATHHAITPDTFTATGIDVVSGRGIGLEDAWGAPRVAVVNRHVAARYFERGEAVGRDIYIGTAWPRVPHRVVGIVDDDRPRVLGGALQPRETVYLSALQHPPAAPELLVRGAGAERPPATESGAAVRLTRIIPEAELARREARPLAWFGRWFGLAGLAALVIALGATFDTVRLWVRSVTGELAMRRAVGATHRRIALYVGGRAVLAVAGGALAGAAVFATLLADYLVRSVPALPRWDLAVVAACSGVLLAAAVAGAAAATREFVREPPAHWLR